MMFQRRSICTFLAAVAGVESFTAVNNKILYSTPVAFGPFQQQQQQQHSTQVVRLAQSEPRRRSKGIFSLNTLAENDAEAIESTTEEKGANDGEENAKKTYPEEDITKIVYIVNLSYDTPSYKLRELCNEHGEVQKLFMPKEKNTGKPKGIAFVTMSSEEERDLVIEKLNESEIDGRTIYVDKAKPRSEKGTSRALTKKKLYVGNISYDSTKEDLIDFFSQYGDVEDVYIPTDRESGYPRGFAFITMKNEEADAAIEGASGVEFMGRTIDVKESLPRGQKTTAKERKRRDEVKLYIGNMSFDTDEDTLRSLFEEFGEIIDLYQPMDRFSGRPRGFAFVTMNPDDAANAIDGTDGLELDGRILRVNEAQPKGFKYQSTSDDEDWGDEGDWGEEEE